jgi:hypothetical protein
MKKKRTWLILITVLGLAALLAVFGFNRNTTTQHFTAKVERGEINDVVNRPTAAEVLKTLPTLED